MLNSNKRIGFTSYTVMDSASSHLRYSLDQLGGENGSLSLFSLKFSTSILQQVLALTEATGSGKDLEIKFISESM